jgi:hypothetical protein
LQCCCKKTSDCSHAHHACLCFVNPSEKIARSDLVRRFTNRTCCLVWVHDYKKIACYYQMRCLFDEPFVTRPRNQGNMQLRNRWLCDLEQRECQAFFQINIARSVVACCTARNPRFPINR